jgi:hypothetical protein
MPILLDRDGQPLYDVLLYTLTVLRTKHLASNTIEGCLRSLILLYLVLEQREVCILLIAGGTVWILRGINVLPGSFMTGQIQWAYRGAIPRASALMIATTTHMTAAISIVGTISCRAKGCACSSVANCQIAPKKFNAKFSRSFPPPVCGKFAKDLSRDRTSTAALPTCQFC